MSNVTSIVAVEIATSACGELGFHAAVLGRVADAINCELSCGRSFRDGVMA